MCVRSWDSNTHDTRTCFSMAWDSGNTAAASVSGNKAVAVQLALVRTSRASGTNMHILHARMHDILHVVKHILTCSIRRANLVVNLSLAAVCMFLYMFELSMWRRMMLFLLLLAVLLREVCHVLLLLLLLSGHRQWKFVVMHEHVAAGALLMYDMPSH